MSGGAPEPRLFEGYEIVRELGAGAWGSVYLARRGSLEVAIKVLHESDPDALGRFAREAEACAAVDRHPNIIHVRHFALTPRPYLVLDYVAGQSLDKLLKPDQPWPLERVLPLLEKLGSALDHIHRAGILHRDLKAANVLLRGEDGEVFLSDFGLAWRNDGRDLTQSREMIGTPVAMAPEQILGKSEELGPKTDVWALGVLAYQLLSGGRLPFSGCTLEELARAIVGEPPVPIGKWAPELPEAVGEALMLVFEKSPEKRPGSAGAYVAAVRDAQSGPSRPRRRSVAVPLLVWLGFVFMLGFGFQSLVAERRASAWLVRLEPLVLEALAADKAVAGAEKSHLITHLRDELKVEGLPKPEGCEGIMRMRQALGALNARLRLRPKGFFFSLIGDPRSRLGELLPGKRLEELRESARFFKAIEGGEELATRDLSRRLFLEGFSLLRRGKPGEAHRAFEKLSMSRGEFVKLAPIGLAVAALRSRHFSEAGRRLGAFSKFPALAPYVPVLRLKIGESRVLAAIFAEGPDQRAFVALGAFVNLLKKRSPKSRRVCWQNLEEKFAELLAGPEESAEVIARAFVRVDRLQVEFPRLAPQPPRADAAWLLAERARQKSEMVRAMLFYGLAYRLDGQRPPPRGFEFGSAAKTFRSRDHGRDWEQGLALFVLASRFRLDFDAYGVGGALFRAEDKVRLLSKQVERRPGEAYGYYWRAMREVPLHVREKPEAFRRFCESRLKDCDSALRLGRLCPAQRGQALCLRAMARTELAKFSLVTWDVAIEAGRRDLREAIPLSSAPDGALRQLLELELGRSSHDEVLPLAERLREAVEDRYRRTVEGRLDEGRPYGSGFRAMKDIDYRKMLGLVDEALGYRLFQERRFAEAEAAGRRALGRFSKSESGVALLALALTFQGRLESARRLLARMTGEKPSQALLDARRELAAAEQARLEKR